MLSLTIARIICIIGRPIYWIIFALFAYLNNDKKKYNRLLAIMFFGMILNAVFKCIFKIPLDPSIEKNWYAFPSGHMQAGIIFFGWLWYEFPKKSFAIGFPLFLLADAWAMWVMGYHIWFDMFGAVISGAMVLGCYRFLCLKTSEKNQSYFGLIFGVLGTICLWYIHLSCIDHWGCVGALFGLGIGSMLTPPIKTQSSLLKKNILALIGFGCIIKIFCFLQPYVTLQLHWFFVAFSGLLWITYGVEKTLTILNER